MLGGQESFVKGKFDRTPIGEMLPVYVNRFAPSVQKEIYQLQLTREGWMQPWVRVRSTRSDEEQRLADMPRFKTINRVHTIKPGASVIAEVNTSDGQDLPALVVQRFGKGKAAALMIGDYWRWHLHNDTGNEDMLIAWRQMIRWLVADVPRRAHVEVKLPEGSSSARLIAKVFDDVFSPLNNASVVFNITQPIGSRVSIKARESTDSIGEYETDFMCHKNGYYQVNATVTERDGKIVESSSLGWVSDPTVAEFSSVQANADLMRQIAENTQGEAINIDRLEQFVDSLPDRNIPFIEKHKRPWWHHWTVFTVAIGLLVTEWGLRRWKGMA